MIYVAENLSLKQVLDTLIVKGFLKEDIGLLNSDKPKRNKKVLVFSDPLKLKPIELQNDSLLVYVGSKETLPYKTVGIDSLNSSSRSKVVFSKARKPVWRRLLSSEEDKSFVQKFYSSIYKLRKEDQSELKKKFFACFSSKNPHLSLSKLIVGSEFNTYVISKEGEHDVAFLVECLKKGKLNKSRVKNNVTQFDFNYLKSMLKG